MSHPHFKSSIIVALLITLKSTFVDCIPIREATTLKRRFTFVAKPIPYTYNTKELEDYETYHARYLLIGCHLKHETQFFKDCCHPRQQSDDVEDFPAYCSLSSESLIKANELVQKSTSGTGNVKEDHVGTGVYVPAGSIVALDPIQVDGKNSSLPPTEQQVKAIKLAQIVIAKSNADQDSSSEPEDHGASSSVEASATKATGASPTPSKVVKHDDGDDNASVTTHSSSTQAPSSAKSTLASNTQAPESVKSTPASTAPAAAKPTTSPPKDNGDASDQGNDDDNKNGGSELPGVSKVLGGGDGDQATFFFQNGVAGACGTVHDDSTPLVALTTEVYNNGAHCGRSVFIKNTVNGKTVTATVQDECPTCRTSQSLDLSTGAYDKIGDRDTGVLPIIWGFLD